MLSMHCVRASGCAYFAEICAAGIRRCKGTTTPVVSAVFDKQGELAAAVADTYAIVSLSCS
jgi:hypothetical protein